MNTEIRELESNATTLTRCPAWVLGGDEMAQECGQELRVRATMTIVGDDFGDWATFHVFFECGHTLEDMKRGLSYGQYE